MIEFRNVTKSFNDEVVLSDISFKISDGETNIILGASGSGKSTILKLILGLMRPDTGQIFINGQDITLMTEFELVEVRRSIGMVFQEGALFDSLSVRENVGYRLFEEAKQSEEAIEAMVLQLLGFVGLAEAIDKMPAELSGGMKRRVGIARALMGTPKIVLYDEPTAGLDPITKRTIVELMIKLRDLEGVTTVFVTHDLPAAQIIATQYAAPDQDGDIRFYGGADTLCLPNVHFVMLHEGFICFEGSYEELKESHQPYVRIFTSW
ncbi:MAG TPA: ATP-binding cassette domain-containing protein [Acidobacteriota bacterium]|nr:ATP-binding cassette domain-containing protein [Acidobacteriota bacterium]